MRREAGEAERARDRQAAASSLNEAEETTRQKDEATGGRTTRVGLTHSKIKKLRSAGVGGTTWGARVGGGCAGCLRERFLAIP